MGWNLESEKLARAEQKLKGVIPDDLENRIARNPLLWAAIGFCVGFLIAWVF